MASKLKARLTEERIRQLQPPDRGEVTLWDTDVIGFGVRCIASGAKSYIVTYRAGYGRDGVARRMTLGKVGGIRLSDAREVALDIRAQVLKGGDPVEERRLARVAEKRPELTVSEALTRYKADQERRQVADRANVASSLERHLLGHVGDIPVRSVSRRAVVEAIESLETAKRDDGGVGFFGAAKALRSNASTFLKWCADQGLIETNPMQGYRASRTTRAQRVALPGRELSDRDLALVWHAGASTTVNGTYGSLVRLLILTGQRRTETARMRWADVDLASGVWRIPAAETKNGIAHEVPLPPLAMEVLQSVPRRLGADSKRSEWVFTTNGEHPVSGWSKFDASLRDAANALANAAGENALEHWTLHDLRRTFRSGLSRLGVDQEIAEIMLNHRPSTLRSIYDREPRMSERTEAAKRWAHHVGAVIDPDSRRNVVPLGAEK